MATSSFGKTHARALTLAAFLVFALPTHALAESAPSTSLTPDAEVKVWGTVGATCGSANGAQSDTAPSSDKLCSVGSASSVSDTGTGWSWTCTSGTTSASCTASKPSKPDLIISVDPTAVPVIVNKSATFTATVKNQGAAATASSFTNIFQFDNSIDATRNTLNTGTTTATVNTALAQGGIKNFSGSSPAFPSAGTYYVRACTDENASMQGTISESREDNNCGNWIPFTVSPPPSCGTAQGQSYADPGPSTNLCGSGANASVVTGGSGSSWTWTCTDPNNGNNTTSCSASYTIPPKANLVPLSITSSPSPITAGTPTTFTATIKNAGGANAGAFDNQFQRALSSSFSSPMGAGSPNVSGLTAGQQTALQSSQQTFSGSGTKYIKICVDSGNTIDESNEGDNCLVQTFSVSSSVCGTAADVPTRTAPTGSALCVSGYTASPTTATRDNTSPINPWQWTCKDSSNNTTSCSAPFGVADLRVESFSPLTALLGAQTTFTVGLKNVGNWTTTGSGGVEKQYNATMQVGSGALDGLDSLVGPTPSGGSTTGNITHSAFTVADTKTVQVCADKAPGNTAAIQESDETNNCETYYVEVISPELVAGDVTWSPGNPTSADTVTFSSVVTNKGKATTGVGFTNLFQFDDDTDHNTVTASANDTSPVVGSNGTDTSQVTYQFPHSGTWYVRACADKANQNDTIGAIDENNENNNCSQNWSTVTVAPVGCVESQGTACTSSPNSCGATNGTVACDGSCTPPAPSCGGGGLTVSCSIVSTTDPSATCGWMTSGTCTVHAGTTITYNAVASGGSTPYTYTWSDTSDTSGTNSSDASNQTSHTYNTDGQMTVTADDSGGKTGSDTCPIIQVASVCSPSANVSMSATPLVSGQTTLTWHADHVDGACSVTKDGATWNGHTYASLSCSDVVDDSDTDTGVSGTHQYCLVCEGAEQKCTTVSGSPGFQEF